jgi:hypothetical protein
MFLWATTRALELARECLDIWGYKCVDEIIWVKRENIHRCSNTLTWFKVIYWLIIILVGNFHIIHLYSKCCPLSLGSVIEIIIPIFTGDLMLHSGGLTVKIWKSENFECIYELEIPKIPDFTSELYYLAMYLIQAPPPPPGLPSPSLALAVVMTSKKASCIRVYEGNPNKISQTFMSKLYEGELLYTALEVFPGIILFPVDNQEIVLWNFRKDSEKIYPWISQT